MFFGASKAQSSQGKPQCSCDVFAVACDLRTQLHTIEERLQEGQELGEDLRRKCTELQEVLRLFQMIEENEKRATRELEEELENTSQSLPRPSASVMGLAISATSSFADRSGFFTKRSRSGTVANKENNFGRDSIAEQAKMSAASAFPRNVIPESWMQRNEVANPIRTALPSAESNGSTAATSTTAACGGSLVRKKLKRVKALEKLRRTDLKCKPYKARKQFKAPRIRPMPGKTSRKTGGDVHEGHFEQVQIARVVECGP